jgi:Photosynthesis system II assembly factor YCF48
MPSDDRDKQFDRALARHLRSATPDAACPDAEILAAYHERSLSLEEMAHWKAHIVSCSHCQETLALLEQTEFVSANDWEKGGVPAALQASRSLSGAKDTEKDGFALARSAASATPAPVEIRSASKGDAQARRRVPWSILAPTAALAAGLLVWVAVHERTNFSMKKTANAEVAENRESLPPPSSSAPQYGKAEPRDEGTASLQSYTREDRKTATALTSPALHSQVPSSTPSAVPPSPAGRELGGPERDKLALLDAENSRESLQKGAGASSGAFVSKRVVAAAPAAPKAAGARGGGPLVANQMQNQNNMQNANQAPAPAANRPVGQVSEQVTVEAAKQPAAEEKTDAQQAQKQKSEDLSAYSTTESVSVIAGAVPVNGRDLSALRLLGGNIIFAPNKKQAWRVGPAGKIERSSDAGKSWKPQKSDVATDLVSGSAPAENICWIAGKSGMLLLTTDGGKHWKQIASPISEDMGGVLARDAQHASIWDVPRGRTFETSDGGLTWKQIASE